jgi:GAF domain-containing protein
MFFNLFFNSDRYPNPKDLVRARIVAQVLIIAIVVYTLQVSVVPYSFDFAANSTVLQASFIRWEFAIQTVFTVATFIITIVALRAGQLLIAESALVAALYVAGVVFAWYTSSFRDAPDGMVAVVVIVTGGLLLRRRGIIITVMLTLLSFVGGVLTHADWSALERLTFIGAGSLLLIGVAGIMNLLIGLIDLARQEGQRSANEERLKLAQINSDLGQRISRREPLSQVLGALVENIRIAYPQVYHVQVFLVNENGQEARLAASTGEIGRQLLLRGHSLGVGSLSVIGQAVVRHTPVIERADSPESVHKRNELLPETAVEAAFPLLIADKIIGALDFQSKVATTFENPEDVTIFASLAESLAIAIDNARLFEQTEQRLRENQKLIDQTRLAMREVETLNERLTGRAWLDYLKDKAEDLSMVYDFGSDVPVVYRAPTWTNSLKQAILENELVEQRTGDQRTVSIPLRVQGQLIGAMEFELDQNVGLSPDDLNLVQEVSERFGLAVENVRLLEESQRLATREALVNEISTRLQGTSRVETTLAETARRLQDALKAERVSIRLGQPPKKG